MVHLPSAPLVGDPGKDLHGKPPRNLLEGRSGDGAPSLRLAAQLIALFEAWLLA